MLRQGFLKQGPNHFRGWHLGLARNFLYSPYLPRIQVIVSTLLIDRPLLHDNLPPLYTHNAKRGVLVTDRSIRIFWHDPLLTPHRLEVLQ